MDNDMTEQESHAQAAYDRRGFLKRTAAAGVAVGSAGSLWAALGGTSGASLPRASSARPLQMLAWDVEPAQIKANVAAFTRQTGDKVTLGIIPGSSYAAALQTRRQGGALLDVYYNYMVDSGRFNAAGWSAKLNKFSGAEQMIADMFPSSRSRYQLSNGQIISAPYFTAVHLLHYNEKFLKQINVTAPPSTLQEIYTQSKKLKSAGITQSPYDAFWRKDFLEQYLFVYFLGQGITPFDAKDNPVFGDHAAAAEEVLAWWQTMYQEGLTPKTILTPDPNANAVNMAHGTTAFLELHHYYLQIIRSGGGPQANNVQLSYRPPGTTGQTLQIGEVLQMGNKSGSSASRAWDLLRFYGWKDNNGRFTTFTAWAKSLALLAPYPALFKDPGFVKAFPSYYNLPALEKVHRNAEVVPTRVRPWYPAFATAVGNRISSLVLGQATPKATLQGLVSDARTAKLNGQ